MGQGIDVLVGVVHHGIEAGHHLHEPVIDLPHAPAETALQLPHSVAGGGGGFGIDEVRHGLRLNEVHPPVEEGPLGELAALGLPGALGEQGVQSLIQHHRRAVAVDLGAVLPGVAVGAGEQHRQSAVYDASLPVV